jgi:hypothetical protein
MLVQLLSITLLPRTSWSQSAGMYIYPSKGQSQEQQDKDRYDCHRWAVQQTGFDPSNINPNNPTYLDPQPYQPSQRHVLRGAARGTAMGVVGGAIAGNAGKGAAAGAAMGGMSGGFRRMDERRQQQSTRQQAAQSNANQVAGYQRAMAACLKGRGYSVN